MEESHIMSSKKPTYEELRHDLDSAMLKASSLSAEQERREFVTLTFVSIHKHYTEKTINHADYLKLINRLAAFKSGAFNDYIDMLAGSAQVGALAIAVEQSRKQDLAKLARQRSQAVNDLTGTEPIQPDTERE
jgi:hypothetical protein